MRDFTEGAQPCGRPRRVHVPKSKPQRAFASTNNRPAHEYAFLRLEAESQGWRALSMHAPRVAGDQVHARLLACRPSQAVEGAAGDSANRENRTHHTSCSIHSSPSVGTTI